MYIDLYEWKVFEDLRWTSEEIFALRFHTEVVKHIKQCKAKEKGLSVIAKVTIKAPSWPNRFLGVFILMKIRNLKNYRHKHLIKVKT